MSVGVSWIIFSIVALLLSYFVVRNNTRKKLPLASKVLPNIPDLLGGKSCNETTGCGNDIIECFAPALGLHLSSVRPHSSIDISEAISRAKESQSAWAQTSFNEREVVLKSLLNYILANSEDIIEAVCLDSGKPRPDAALGEILTTAERIRWTLRHGRSALKPSYRSITSLLMAHKRGYIIYEPLGVVAALVSWNYPFHNMMAPIVSALYAGNAIVIKVSERTVYSSVYFHQIIQNVLQACGYSSDLVQLITCWPDAAVSLSTNEHIKHITFIGSRQVGIKVAQSAASRLIPCTMELGGKDPAIVLACALKKLPCITDILMRAVYQAAGQNCVGIERIICLTSVYNPLLKLFTSKVKQLKTGPYNLSSVDVGAMLSDQQFYRLENLISDAVERGAQLLTGGHRLSGINQGFFFEPTVLAGVTRDMPIAQEELFAPIALFMHASSIDEAISIANSTSYALGASIFGSESQSLKQCTLAINAGMVAANDFATYYTCQLPFGGTNGSGYGRFAGKEGLRSLTNPKSISEDRFSFIYTSIPSILQYPISDSIKSMNFVLALLQLSYAPLLIDKIRALKLLWSSNKSSNTNT